MHVTGVLLHSPARKRADLNVLSLVIATVSEHWRTFAREEETMRWALAAPSAASRSTAVRERASSARAQC
jgi:hypothetical protein